MNLDFDQEDFSIVNFFGLLHLSLAKQDFILSLPSFSCSNSLHMFKLLPNISSPVLKELLLPFLISICCKFQEGFWYEDIFYSQTLLCFFQIFHLNTMNHQFFIALKMNLFYFERIVWIFNHFLLHKVCTWVPNKCSKRINT